MKWGSQINLENIKNTSLPACFVHSRCIQERVDSSDCHTPDRPLLCTQLRLLPSSVGRNKPLYVC